MKVDLDIMFVSGRRRIFENVDFPMCKTVDKVKSQINKERYGHFININGTMVSIVNIEMVEVTESSDKDLNEKLKEYREKNPEYKKEK